MLIERIPGKSTVGIQIPNPNREAISLRELLESETYQRSGVEADAGAGQDHSRRAVHGRSGDDAAPADRRLDRHRQVGGPERDAYKHPLSRDAGRCPAHHDRSEASRARDVRGHSAPAVPSGRRSEKSVERLALGGARDGRAVQDTCGVRRAQHRAVQPQHATADRGEVADRRRRAAPPAALHRRHRG